MSWWVWAIVILVILGILGNNKENEEKEAAKEANNEAQKRRKEAEDYIMNSGDQEAIKALMLARANPSNYTQTLSSGMNKGNDTLKTALGVMTGVVAGNLIANAITAAQIQGALENMQAEFNKMDFNPFDDSVDSETVADGSEEGFDSIDA